MIAKLQSNRVRRTYLGGGRIDAFTGGARAQVTTDNVGRAPSPCQSDTFRQSGKDEGVLATECGRLQGPSTGCGCDMPRPEDWLASTTTAFNGTLEIEGEGLGRLEDGRLVKDVVGTLPILVKLLDSDERLVIQAHPTVPCAKRLFNSPVGKTECWYFLPGMAPDACVYLGFKPGITREAWEEAVRAGIEDRRQKTDDRRDVEKSKSRSACRMSHVACPNPAADAQERAPPAAGAINCAPPAMLSYLHRIPVAAGDFVFVDGGMPHAIGGGCFMIELQEPSDLMVVAERVTPSGRRIPDAKMLGGVGWEKMFDVYEYGGMTFEETCAKYVRKCSQMSNVHKSALSTNVNINQICGKELTDKFEMWRVTGGGRVTLPRDRSVAVVTDGEGAVNGHEVAKGDRLLIAEESQIAVAGSVTLIVCV